MGKLDEYGQQYERLPKWAPRPEYRPNGRPAETMVEFLTKYHGEDQQQGTAPEGK